MQQEIIYCEKCGLRIPWDEIVQGSALVTNRGAVCPRCEDGLSPEDWDRLLRRKEIGPQAPAPDERDERDERAAAGSAGGAGATEWNRKRVALLVAGALAGWLLLAVLIAVLVSSGRESPGRESSGREASFGGARPAEGPPGSREGAAGATGDARVPAVDASGSTDEALGSREETAGSAGADRTFGEAPGPTDDARAPTGEASGSTDEPPGRVETPEAGGARVRAAEAEAAREAAGRREAWTRFLLALRDAGKRSIADAEASLGRRRGEVEGLGFGEKIARLEGRLRKARFVDELALTGLGSAVGTVRVRWKGTPVSGVLVGLDRGRDGGVKGSVLRLRTALGREQAIPAEELSPETIVRYSRVARSAGDGPVRAASYLLSRGDPEAALEALGSAGARELREDIADIAAVVRPGSGPVAAGDVNAGLVAHWKFDDRRGATARDSSAGKNHAAIRGATWAKGKIGAALAFDGRDDYVDTRKKITELVTRDLTISFWARSDEHRPFGCFFSASDSGPESLYLRQTGPRRRAALPVQIGLGDWGADIVSAYRLGEWVHYAVVVHGTGARVYVGGEERASKRTVRLPRGLPGAATLKIGSGCRANGCWFEGAIDDFRVHDRALSAAEVAALGRAPR